MSSCSCAECLLPKVRPGVRLGARSQDISMLPEPEIKSTKILQQSAELRHEIVWKVGREMGVSYYFHRSHKKRQVQLQLTKQIQRFGNMGTPAP